MNPIDTTADSVLDELRNLLGGRLSTSPYDIESHSRDESHHPPAPPDAVAFVESSEEAAEVVRICSRHKTPMIPFGTGTSVEGNVQALEGGVSIDLTRMDSILEVNVDDLDCRVQAGVKKVQLNDHLQKQGLFFPVDPGADASIGGMAATGASGTTTVRYGTMRETVLGLTVVLPDGRIVQTGGRARKSSAGFDLTRLFVGSEGTLGLITEIQLRLHPLPEAISAAVCPFETLEGAVLSVTEILQSGIPAARMELLDTTSMRAVNAHSKLDYVERPTIFFEFHGTPQSVEEQAKLSGEIVRDHGAGEFRWTTYREKREELWEARHRFLYAAKALKPGSIGWSTDVCVPISRLAECILETSKEIDAAGAVAPILGHAGDGNFHVVFIIDPSKPEELETAKQINHRMVERALAMGGTSTGEHGIGMGKLDFLKREHGEGVEVMRQIKQALDPEGLMNPGKIFGPIP